MHATAEEVARVVFLTPSYPGDFGRLALLRESMRRFDVQEPHLVVVDRAHREQALALFAGPGVEVLDKAALCPGSSRLLSRCPHGLGRHLRVGWWQQQYAKLNAGRALGLSSWLCLDSDTFLMAPLGERDFRTADGRLALVELIDAPVGRHVRDANSRSAKVLHLAPELGGTHRMWTAQCVPFHGQVVDELLDWLTAAYRTPWWLTMTAHRGTEYALYGLFARYVHGLRLVEPTGDHVAASLFRQLPVPEAVAFFQAERSTGQARLAMVHSHLPYTDDELRAITTGVWA